MARARLAVASVGVTYVAFVAIGIGMVSIGNTYAIERRDAIVAGAGCPVRCADPGLLAYWRQMRRGGMPHAMVGVQMNGSPRCG